MTTAPAITALGLVKVVERHMHQPADTDVDDLRLLLADPADELVHADHVVDVAVELARLLVRIAAATDYRLDAFVDDCARLLAHADDAA